MILVVGSTGLLGSEICKLLARKGIPLRVMLRACADPIKVEQLKKFGAAVTTGDLHDPASLAAACRGIQGIICTASAFTSFSKGKNDFQTVDLAGITSLINVAEKVGVSRFIFPSFSSSIVMQSPLLHAKRNIEKYLRESALVYTIIRASFFMETWFSPAAGFDPLGARASFYGNGMNPIRWISCRNVAQRIVHSLYNPDAYETTLELVGPEPLSPRQVTALFEEAGQRIFEITCIAENALQAERKSSTDPLRRSWLSLLLDYAHGDGRGSQTQPPAFDSRLISVQEYCTAFYELQRKEIMGHNF